MLLKKERAENFKLINNIKLQVKKTLKFYTSSNINLYIKPCDTFMGLPFTNAAILAKLLAFYHKTNKGYYLRFIKYLFKMAAKLKTISGLQVIVTGRSQSSARSKQFVYKYGRVPTQSLKANIDYYYTKTLDRSGISGIKVWVYGSKI